MKAKAKEEGADMAEAMKEIKFMRRVVQFQQMEKVGQGTAAGNHSEGREERREGGGRGGQGGKGGRNARRERRGAGGRRRTRE